MPDGLRITKDGMPADSRSDDTVVIFEIERPGFETWLESLAILRTLLLHKRRPDVAQQEQLADDFRWFLFRERVCGQEDWLTFKQLARDMQIQ